MEKENKPTNTKLTLLSAGSAMTFVILLGIVSLLSDMTYEGGRSLVGQYLKLLGASAAAVGVAAGAGEFLGYALRLVTGLVADRTQQYWVFTILGYAVNLLAFPALALVGEWELAVALMLTERIGKAIRSPSKDAMLSYAASEMGRGWGFGLHEAMDQIGAVLGPLLAAGVLSWRSAGEAAGSAAYQRSFGVLIFSALLALTVVFVARFLFPNPKELEDKTPSVGAKGYTRSYWFYIGAVSLIALGFAEYPILAFHFKSVQIAPDAMIPVFYAIAMAVDAVSALVSGWLYDRFGTNVLLGIFGVTAFFAPLAFFGNQTSALVGVILWGVGMGAAESILRVPIAEMVQRDKRASAYGTYHFGFGIGLFAGGALIGWLYDQGLVLPLVLFSVGVQLLALPVIYYAGRLKGREA
jgi:MFS family permease